MKVVAIAGAAVLLVALAFLHPAPRPAASGVILSETLQRSAKSKGGRAKPGLARQLMVIYVAGEVRRPGLYRVPAGARANDAVQMAGSFSNAADRAAVNLAEVVQDGEEIRVPRTGERAPRSPRARKSLRKKREPPRANVDLNSASAGDLAQIPGLGETLAERIVAYREQNGPFASLDELADVSGFTTRRIDTLAHYLVVR